MIFPTNTVQTAWLRGVGAPFMGRKGYEEG